MLISIFTISLFNLRVKNLANPSFNIPTNALLHLKTSPHVSAKKAVEALKDPARNKVTVFELQKSSLKVCVMIKYNMTNTHDS